MGSHIIDGEFQSDKYPSCPPGKVPLSVKDKTAQDLLWEYSKRRESVDAEFSEDLRVALRTAGYTHNITPLDLAREECDYWRSRALALQSDRLNALVVRGPTLWDRFRTWWAIRKFAKDNPKNLLVNSHIEPLPPPK